MKAPKRLKKALKYIQELEEILEYYMSENYKTKGFIRSEDEQHVTLDKKIAHIKELLEDLSVDQKVQNARLWNKFKAISKVGKDDTEA